MVGGTGELCPHGNSCSISTAVYHSTFLFATLYISFANSHSCRKEHFRLDSTVISNLVYGLVTYICSLYHVFFYYCHVQTTVHMSRQVLINQVSLKTFWEKKECSVAPVC